MKKIMTMIALAVFMIVTLTACGTPKPPEEQQIKEDLLSNSANIFYVNYNDMMFEFTDLEITKRATEDTRDIVYVSANLSDENFEVNAEYVLYYSFYDVGDWCLDFYELISYNSVAKKYPLSNEEYEEFMGSYYNNCTITERKEGEDGLGGYNTTIIFTSNIDTEYISRINTYQFFGEYFDNAWNEGCYIIDSKYDFSKLLGKWKLNERIYVSEGFTLGSANAEFLFEILEISQIDSRTFSITYNYDVKANSDGLDKGHITRNNITEILTLEDENNIVLANVPVIDSSRDTTLVLNPFNGITSSYFATERNAYFTHIN